MRKVKREQLACVRYIVSGAEKLPRAFAEAFEERFGKTVLEGYGLTETSPATNVNLPDPVPPDEGVAVIPAHRPGTTGQLLPGIAVRVTDPDSGAPLPLDQNGIIWFRGANIFEGYLNQLAKTEEVLQDGWFRTGDIGHMDADGFLSIEGRLSRFSKIGGEMVPHETVEQHIARAYNLDNEDERKIAVVGVPDEEKGEQLVLLSTVAGETIAQELIQLRYTLLDRGVPALWIPKRLIRIEDVPVLASGKLDIKRCEEIAKQHV
jgi:acyl-[acyl-carrier-protein]-phospholipid O-acyltransferase/long-chain-fatty-acid--[acyl-carrier-protein] ligase